MKIERYPKNLEILVNQHIGRYLEASSKPTLIDRARQLRKSIEKGKKEKHGKWTFSIPRETPLTFKENDCKLQVDISCEIGGINEDIQKQSINLRIWSCDKNISFREGIDAPELKKNLKYLNWKRVVLRFHFDLKVPNGKNIEPLYHLQVGGCQMEGENCWIPEEIQVPRFPYIPMDLILLCEFILMNFFPKKYKELKKDREWISLVRKSQEIFQEPYLNGCMKCINNEEDTLLGKLVSLKGVEREH